RTLHNLIAANEVPALNRLFRAAKEQRWGIAELLARTRLAIEGKYRPHNYSDYEKHLAILVYELGGAAALYALNHATTALPSRWCIASLRREYNLVISVGKIKMLDLFANIETGFKDVPPDHQRTGVTMCVDEVACEERPRWIRETDEIAGLCEHAAELDSITMGNDLTTVRALAHAIREAKTVHIGHELTVIAFSRHDGKNYGAKPVLILPTCKRGDYYGAAEQLALVMEAWRLSPYGEKLHGPVWSIGSDGDPKRRPAFCMNYMWRRVLETDALYKHLGNVKGLNMYTGKNFETPALDWKHDFKRILKLLSSAKDGILINNLLINKTLLSIWFERLKGHNWAHESIESLFNMKDGQDVPRVIKFLCLVADLRDLDEDDYNPSERHTYRALRLLGEMCGALVEPFILLDLSLSEQITRLLRFAYLAFAVFRKHEGSFLPGQLYFDLQCMVKNAVFIIAHAKELNPAMKVFLCLL
ncbi:hypothetical protein BDZ89DRAFT_912987, partial [Hymenopellis radicata]